MRCCPSCSRLSVRPMRSSSTRSAPRRGSLSPRTNWKSLADVKFALPPIEEQRRIADALRTCETALISLSHAVERAESLVQSTCVDFGFALLADESLPLQSIEKAGEVRMGRQRSHRYQTGEFTAPYLRVTNVYDGYFKLDDVLEMDFNKSDFDTY